MSGIYGNPMGYPKNTSSHIVPSIHKRIFSGRPPINYQRPISKAELNQQVIQRIAHKFATAIITHHDPMFHVLHEVNKVFLAKTPKSNVRKRLQKRVNQNSVAIRKYEKTPLSNHIGDILKGRNPVKHFERFSQQNRVSPSKSKKNLPKNLPKGSKKSVQNKKNTVVQTPRRANVNQRDQGRSRGRRNAQSLL